MMIRVVLIVAFVGVVLIVLLDFWLCAPSSALI